MKEELGNTSSLSKDEYVIYSVGTPPNFIIFTNKGIYGDYRFISWDNVEFCSTTQGDKTDGDAPCFTVYLKVPWLDTRSFNLPWNYSRLTLEDKTNVAYNVFMKTSGKADSDANFNIIDNSRDFWEKLKTVVHVVLFVTIAVLIFRELYY